MPFRLTDTEWVMVVVAAIYLFECACWVRREAVCLSTVLGRFRVLPSPSFMGNERYKLVMGNPSPLARCFLCRVVADRHIARRESAFPKECRCPPAGRQLASRFRAMRRFRSRSKRKFASTAEPLAACASEEQAKHLAAMLREVAAAGAADRGRTIGEHLDRWTDNAAAAEHVAEMKKASRTAADFGMYVVRAGVPCRAGLVLFALAAVMARSRHLLCCCFFRPGCSRFGTTPRAARGSWARSSPRVSPRGDALVVARFRHAIAGGVPPERPGRISSFGGCRGAMHEDRDAGAARPMMLALEHPKPSEVPGDPAACRIDAWFRKKLLKRLRFAIAPRGDRRGGTAAAGGTAERLAVVLSSLPQPVRARRRDLPRLRRPGPGGVPAGAARLQKCGKID